jgi:transposase
MAKTPIEEELWSPVQ